MTFPILPLLSSPEDPKLDDLSIAGHVLFPYDSLNLSKHWIQQFQSQLSIFVQVEKNVSVDQITELLNLGVEKIFLSDETQYESVVNAGLPDERFASPVLQSNLSLIVCEKLNDLAKYNNDENRDVYYDMTKSDASQDEVDQLAKLGYTVILPSENLTTKKQENGKISISFTFVNTLVTDRQDGLFTTLITSPAPQYTALGIVYSSKESIFAAIDEKLEYTNQGKELMNCGTKVKPVALLKNFSKFQKIVILMLLNLWWKIVKDMDFATKPASILVLVTICNRVATDYQNWMQLYKIDLKMLPKDHTPRDCLMMSPCLLRS